MGKENRSCQIILGSTPIFFVRERINVILLNSNLDDFENLIRCISREYENNFRMKLTLSSLLVITNAILAFVAKVSHKKCQNGICYDFASKNY